MKLVLIEEYKQLLVNYQKDKADIPPGNTTLKIMLAGWETFHDMWYFFKDEENTLTFLSFARFWLTNILGTASAAMQSCEMSRIWRIYPCKNIYRLGYALFLG